MHGSEREDAPPPREAPEKVERARTSGSVPGSEPPPSSAEGRSESGQGCPARTLTRSMGMSGVSPLPRFR